MHDALRKPGMVTHHRRLVDGERSPLGALWRAISHARPMPHPSRLAGFITVKRGHTVKPAHGIPKLGGATPERTGPATEKSRPAGAEDALGARRERNRDDMLAYPQGLGDQGRRWMHVPLLERPLSDETRHFRRLEEVEGS